jgi:hypothetical protein
MFEKTRRRHLKTPVAGSATEKVVRRCTFGRLATDWVPVLTSVLFGTTGWSTRSICDCSCAAVQIEESGSCCCRWGVFDCSVETLVLASITCSWEKSYSWEIDDLLVTRVGVPYLERFLDIIAFIEELKWVIEFVLVHSWHYILWLQE